MISVEKFAENNTYRHWSDKRLEGYIYRNVFDEPFFEKFKTQVKKIFSTSSTDTYLTHTTSFTYNGVENNLIKSQESNRLQHVIFDLTFDKEWRYQTIDSVRDYAHQKTCQQISPHFVKCIEQFYNTEPFVNEPNKWLCYRLHLNVLDYDTFLSIHLDTNHLVYNTHNGSLSRSYSVTFYLDDHKDNSGGELFSINGFSYKPKKNSAIAINGSQILHGVTANMDPDKNVRLAFTMRFAHIEDLFLPGHPDKFLYSL